MSRPVASGAAGGSALGRGTGEHVGTILVVDDDRLSARRHAEMLTGFGHRVVVARTAGHAMERMSDAIDVVLLDVEMPTLDGPRLLPLLRARVQGFVPCVFMTGRDDEAARHRCLDAGGDDFLSKASQPFELRLRVQSMLRIRRLTQELERRASIDPLSGVGNRAALEATLDARANEQLRYGRPLALLLLDVDHFKRVNDRHGHAAGDGVIRCLGEVLRSSTRDADGVYRFGGEEFVVVAPETELAGATLLAERLRRAFTKATRALVTGPQTLSVGVAAHGPGRSPRSPRELLAAADRALYRAKATGRDRVAVEDTLAPPSEAPSPTPPASDPRERPTEPAPARPLGP